MRFKHETDEEFDWHFAGQATEADAPSGSWRIIHHYPSRGIDVIPNFLLTLPGSSRRRFRRTDTEVDDLFAHLCREWQAETASYSSVRDRILHVAYQRIIGLGPQAVPLLVDKLQEDEIDHWFWALAMIVGHDAGVGASTLKEAAKAWTEWAGEQGYRD